MKKLTFKTEKVLAAYRLLGSAKYGKLADEDKIKVLKICIALKPIATKYDEDSKDVAEKLKPSEDYDCIHAHKPWVLKHDGVVYHWYCAVGKRNRLEVRGIALATSVPKAVLPK